MRITRFLAASPVNGPRIAILAVGAALCSSSVKAQTAPSINSTSHSRGAGVFATVPQATFANDAPHRILTSNDLGMHCSSLDSRIASILPPFNVLHAQVLAKGQRPTLLDNKSVSVVFSAAANPKDPLLSRLPTLSAQGILYKSDFWGNAASYNLFYPPGTLGTYMPAPGHAYDVGLPVPDVARLYLGDGKLSLSQATMPDVTQFVVDPVTHVPTSATASPYQANTPQPFRVFEQSWPVFISFPFGYVANNTNWFAAEGIPMSPIDDIGRENPFPLMRVQARDLATGATLASLDTVVPVAAETNCKTCHLPAPAGNGLATSRISQPATAAQDPLAGYMPTAVSQEWAADVNMLRLHDLMHATKLYAGYDANGKAATPIVCQTCHYTPALDLGQAGPTSVAGRLTQTTHRSMSRVMHASHGALMSNGQKLFPDMPAANDPRRVNTTTNPINAFTQSTLEATCYQCHPGKQTQCLRGAMFGKAGAVCQDCHGQMRQVGDDFSRNVPAGGFTIAADFYQKTQHAARALAQRAHLRLLSYRGRRFQPDRRAGRHQGERQYSPVAGLFQPRRQGDAPPADQYALRRTTRGDRRGGRQSAALQAERRYAWRRVLRGLSWRHPRRMAGPQRQRQRQYRRNPNAGSRRQDRRMRRLSYRLARDNPRRTARDASGRQ